MKESNLKNMVVLKNLPSNLVEEAIVILKTNKQAKRLEKINKKIFQEENEKKRTKDYILKEAEMLISNYIKKIENNNNDKIIINKNENKYKKLKRYATIITIIVLIEALLLII